MQSDGCECPECQERIDKLTARLKEASEQEWAQRKRAEKAESRCRKMEDCIRAAREHDPIAWTKALARLDAEEKK